MTVDSPSREVERKQNPKEESKKLEFRIRQAKKKDKVIDLHRLDKAVPDNKEFIPKLKLLRSSMTSLRTSPKKPPS